MQNISGQIIPAPEAVKNGGRLSGFDSGAGKNCRARVIFVGCGARGG